MEEKKLMNEDELAEAARDYIYVEGYTDARSILSVMSQEFPGEVDRKIALKVIMRVLREERA